MKHKAIILYSGGLDSTTLLAIAQQKDFELYALTFDYGQRHACEIDVAQKNSKHFKIKKHIVLPMDLRLWGGSALTEEQDVAKHDSVNDIDSSIPNTYVPARNTIFLSYALAWAEVLQCHDIFIGVNHVDYSGYPDCRPEFIEAFSQLANVATQEAIEGSPITIHTPLIHLSKSDIIKMGHSLGVDYSLTHSCYDPNDKGLACGHCESCLLRQKGFTEAGIPDPTQYH